MLIFLALSQALSQCSKEKLFTKCDSENKRDLIITASKDCAGSYPKLYESLDCDVLCGPGHFLDIVDDRQACVPCPAGSFSLGGGVAYGEEGADWDLAGFVNSCEVDESGYKYNNRNCLGWQIKNGILVSNSTDIKAEYSASLSVSWKVLKKGKMILRYFKDKEGTFLIKKNMEVVYVNVKGYMSNWENIEIPLDIGLNNIFIEWKCKRVRNVWPKAMISELRVSGIKLADHECYKCKKGSSSVGSEFCEVCGFNEYLDGEDCENCPDGTYSFRGSKSINDCLPQKQCTKEDYTFFLTDCVNWKQSQKFAWKTPVFCDTKSYNLPDDVLLDSCLPCDEGTFPLVTGEKRTCQSCPFGKYLDASTANCLDCAAGYYAPKEITINSWNTLPENFETTCINIIGNECSHSYGWVPEGDSLSTGNYFPNTKLVLSFGFIIIMHTGYINVNYTFDAADEGRVQIMLDGKFYLNLLGASAPLHPIHLTTGEHQIQFVFQSTSSLSKFSINSIKIVGSNTGGASVCKMCEDGFISKPDHSWCVACLPGFTSNLEKTECVRCENEFYSYKAGSLCEECPLGTRASDDNTFCIGDSIVHVDNKSYDIKPLVGYNSSGHLSGVCDLSSNKIYCYQTFYGPLPGKDQEYYLSVLNPSYLDLPLAGYPDEKNLGYAFMIENAPFSGKCNNKEIVNIGSNTKGIKSIEGGFLVEYTNGDLCEDGRYRTEFVVLCDKNADVGWPVFLEKTNCSVRFRWRTKFGCPICKYGETRNVSSECRDGKSKVKILPGEGCILVDEPEYFEDCVDTKKPVTDWVIRVLVGLCSFLIIAFVLAVYLFFKYTPQYDHLKSVNVKSIEEN